jgi:predicted secreted protein
MADEQNGTKVVIRKTATPSEIIGQMELTHAINGTPIDISNKSAGDDVLLLDGEVSSQQHVFSGNMVWNSDTNYQTMLTESLTCTQDDYDVVYPGATPVEFSGKFTPSGISISSPHGDKVTSSFTLSSSGPVTKS